MMTREFGEFIAGRPADWDAAAIHAAERAFADTIGCMIAGRRDLAAQRARRTFEQWVDPQTGVQCVNGGLLPAPWAALVNGAAAHALDYDDVSEPALTHPSAALVPALLALALSRGHSGAQVIDAYTIGFERCALRARMAHDADLRCGRCRRCLRAPARAGCAGSKRRRCRRHQFLKRIKAAVRHEHEATPCGPGRAVRHHRRVHGRAGHYGRR